MRRLPLFFTLLAVLAGSSCAPLMGGLRRDLDDSEPASDGSGTVGGQWSERGFLNESMGEAGYGSGRLGSVGHFERGPASFSGGTDPRETMSGTSWLAPGQVEANRRDGVRGTEGDEEPHTPTFSNTPNLQPREKRLYRNGARASRADFIDESTNEGSLWASDGQTNYYFTKNKIRGVGDIVTVALAEEMVKDFSLEIRRNLTPLERGKELVLAQERLRVKTLTQAKEAQAAEQRGTDAKDRKPAASEPPEIPTATVADIEVGKSVEVKTGDTMLAEIVERYPNGNYKIRGSRKVPYRNGNPRVMSLVGIVRGSDIGEDDLVNSGKLYEYRLEALR